MANASTKNAHEQLITRLYNNLPAGYTTARVKVPNYAFTTPSNEKWLRATPIELDNNNVEAGQEPWKRKDGLFVVDVFYPKDAGTDDNLTDAEAIQAVFQNEEFNDVKTQEALIEVLGEFEGWHQTQVSISYYYEGY